MLKLTEQSLKGAGYTGHDQHRLARMNNADYLWQKRVRNADGITLYFINIWQYRGLYDKLEYQQGGDGWTPEVQFYAPGRKVFSVSLLDGDTLEEVETFLNDIYTRMRCEPYDGIEDEP